MSIKIEPITKITIDQTEYLVEEASDKVKNLVVMYNDWREREADARSGFLMCSTAVRGLGNEIVQAIQADNAPEEGGLDEEATEEASE